MAVIDTFLRRAIRRGQLTLIHHDGREVSVGAPDPVLKPVTMRFTHAGVGGRIVRHPDLAAGEAYMNGELIVDRGDVLDLITLITANNRWERGGRIANHPLVDAVLAVKHRLDRVNMARRSKRNVAHHYDLSDRLYDLFLDRDRQYSCAYFAHGGESLDQAQEDKKAHIAAKLAIRPGMRVLDIGCGWGGMALYLHERCGAHVLGITLSEEQLKVARARAAAAGVADRVQFALIDYRHVQGQFDRIVSVGMFEHVGPAFYRTFFRRCRDLLTDDGVMLLHTIGRMGAPGVTDAWTAKYIFPGGYNPALSEIVRGYEGLRLVPADIEVLRLHYGLTLDHWYHRTVAVRAEIEALYGARFFRMWQFYLAGACCAFRYGSLVNYQLQLTKDRHALPITRDYMIDAERRLFREVAIGEEALSRTAAARGP